MDGFPQQIITVVFFPVDFRCRIHAKLWTNDWTSAAMYQTNIFVALSYCVTRNKLSKMVPTKMDSQQTSTDFRTAQFFFGLLVKP